MNASTLTAIIASFALVMLIVGFLIGWARGYQRSILALVITLACAVIAFFIAPIVSNAILNISINSTVNGVAVSTLEEYVCEMIKSIEFVGDLISASPTLESLIIALPSMLANIVLFIVLFIVLKLVLQLILYLPIALTVFGKKRLEGKSKIKLLGAGLGALSAFIIIAVMFVPLFGLVNITSELDSQTAQTTSAVAAVSPSLVSDTSSESVEQSNIEEMIGTTNQYTQAFNNAWIVKVYRGIGIGKLSETVFDNLTEGEVNGTKTSLGVELKNISQLIPVFEVMSNTDGNINASFINRIEKIKNTAFKSEVFTKIVSEVIGNATQKLADGQSFMGLTKADIAGDNELISNLVDSLLNSMKGGNTTTETVKEDVDAIIEVLNVLVNNDVFETLSSADSAEEFLNLITDKDTLVRDLIVQLTESNHFKNVIPEVINIGLYLVYDALDVTLPSSSDATYDNYWIIANNSTNWENAATTIQNIVSKFGMVYTDYANNANLPAVEQKDLFDVIKFADLGSVIDEMRNSELFSTGYIASRVSNYDGPGKELYRGILSYEMLSSIITAEVKTSLIEKYSTYTTETTVAGIVVNTHVVADTFGEIDNMIVVAKTLANYSAESITETGLNDLSKDEINDLLSAVTDSSNVLSDIITEGNLTELGIDSEIINDITAIIDGISNADAPNQEAEINGVATVIDLAVQAQNGTIEMDSDTASDTISAIAGSETIKSILDDDSSYIVNNMDISDQIDQATKDNLESAIAEAVEAGSLTSAQQAALNRILGIG